MSTQSESPTPRREFLGQMAASALVLAGTACAAPATLGQTTTAATPAGTPAPRTTFDDSWFGRLTAKHKAVFDSPDIDGSTGVAAIHATRYLDGMRDGIGAGAGDVQTVIVFRHKAIPLAFNDAMWEKYAVGEWVKVKGTGDAWATKNPIASGRQSGTRPNANAGADRPQSNLAWLASHGHILLGCDLALQGHASDLASRTKGNYREIYDELKANLVPGLILQPNGVYAVHRAQEAGCTYIRST